MPTETLATSAPVSRDAPARHRYRLRFSKTGELRFVSHHDLMHVVERMMRRAELPFAVTQGFHPQPKMSFALSLALGVVGRNEVFDIELTCDLPGDELLSRLNQHAPAGLAFLSVLRLEKKPSSQVRRTFYRLIFRNAPESQSTHLAPRDEFISRSEMSTFGDRMFSGGTSIPDPVAPPSPNGGNGGPSPSPNGEIDLPTQITDFLSKTEHWIVRTRPQPRRINIRPFVADLSADESGLSMILWVTPTGAARPEEIVLALGLGPALEAGAVLERTHLELLDEVPEHERFVPDLSATATSAPAPETSPLNDATPGETQSRAPQPTALIANPLSFDT